MLHRDLKPANIFVGHGLVMKIGDFGMSRQVQALKDAPRPTLDRQLTRGVIGTAAYAAPELLGVESPCADADSNPARVLKADVSPWHMQSSCKNISIERACADADRSPVWGSRSRCGSLSHAC